jgi:16S rRNA processing protein RimM
MDAGNSMIKIGRFNKTFGLKGHIRAYIEPEVLVRLRKVDALFIMSKDKPLPYFVDEADLNESGHCMFHFEELKDKTAVDVLVGKEIFFDAKNLKKAKPYSSLGDYAGFKLIDEKLGPLDVLDSVAELPGHSIGQFTHNGNEVLFPWNDEVVIQIDKKKKEIMLRLPEGLMDIYLQ